MQNISLIKQRILKFADTYYSNRSIFYEKAGILESSLESDGSITEETINRILGSNPNLSLYWVIFGEGDILSGEKKRFNRRIESDDYASILKEELEMLIKEKEAMIKDLKKEITEQKEIISLLIDNVEKHYERLGETD